MKHRILVILTLLITVSMLLAACAPTEAVKTVTVVKTQVVTEIVQGEVVEKVITATPEPTKPAGKTKIVVLDASTRAELDTDLMSEYQKLHPELEIDHRLTDYRSFTQSMSVLREADAQLDVIIGNPNTYLDLINLGMLYDLTDKITYYDRFNPLLFDQWYRVHDKVYAIPFQSQGIMTMVINKVLWDKVGCEYPFSSEETVSYAYFKECGDKMIALGYTPFLVPGSYILTMDKILGFPPQQLVGDSVDIMNFTKDTVAGRKSFTDPVWVQAWYDAKKWVDDGMVGDFNTVLGMDEATQMQLFPSGNYGATVTWNGNLKGWLEASAANPDKFQPVMMLVPRTTSAAPDAPVRSLNGAAMGLYVYSGSTHLEESLEMIDWLSSDENAVKVMDFTGSTLVANVNAVPPFELTDQDKLIIDIYKKGFFHPGVIMGDALYVKYWDDWANVVLGKMTPEEALAKVEAWAEENRATLPQY